MGERSRILIVDDQEEICDMLRDFLTDEGFEVECVTRGASARAALQNDKFELVIVDALLTDEPGLGLAALASDLGIDVILMSGDPAHLHLSDDEPYLCLGKPFRLESFRSLVHAALRAAGGDGRR
jgi:DNA-binding response OmpR family regulator